MKSLLCCLFEDGKEGKCSAFMQCCFFFTPLRFCISNLTMMRTKLRGTFKIKGTVCQDWCYTTW